MVKTVSVYSLAGVFAALLMVSGYAEITGSGFRDIGCSGEFTLNFFMDHDGDGLQGKFEEGFSNAELHLSLTNYPAMGVEKFVTDSDGFVRIGALCKGVFSIDVDSSTIPADAVFDGMYEYGELIIDASMDDSISVPLSGGSTTAPGMRYLDMAYGTVIERVK